MIPACAPDASSYDYARSANEGIYAPPIVAVTDALRYNRPLIVASKNGHCHRNILPREIQAGIDVGDIHAGPVLDGCAGGFGRSCDGAMHYHRAKKRARARAFWQLRKERGDARPGYGI